MSIKLEVDSWCENCPDFEADVNKNSEEISYYNQLNMFNYIESLNNTTITCKHRDRCKCIKQYLEDERRKGMTQAK